MAQLINKNNQLVAQLINNNNQLVAQLINKNNQLVAQLINKNNQLVAQLMNPNKLRDRKRKLCWKCCITQAHVRNTANTALQLPCSGIQQPYNQSKQVFPSNHIFYRTKCLQIKNIQLSNLWVYVAYGMSPNAGGYPHQGHHN